MAEGGCAAIMPTVITSPLDVYERVLPMMRDVLDGNGDAEDLKDRLLGIHLEGPFITFAGAHAVEHMQSRADVQLLRRWQDLAGGHIRLVTMAADVDGMAEFCDEAKRMGIRISLGHQLATTPAIRDAVQHGATLLTHFGNAMPGTVPRFDNAFWVGLSDDRLHTMLISDGVHVPPEFLGATLRAKGVERCIVTSDVAPVAGLASGEYTCFNTRVIVDGLKVRSAAFPDRLAGSGSLMLHCMNHLASLGDLLSEQRSLTLRELELVGFYNPLQALGIDGIAWCKQIYKGPRCVVWHDDDRQFSLL